MRNLSMCGVLLVLGMIAILSVFSMPFSCSQFCVYASHVETDDTSFNLYYENKIWRFKASDFDVDSNIFTINARINKFGKNNRENKVKILNKLIDINILPEIAFNYIYLGFNKKLNNIIKNIEIFFYL